MWCSGVAPSMYEKLTDDIERLVSMKAPKYKIPGYEHEDIAQEIRMVAYKALQRYDAAKNHSTPFHFIARCVDNYLINLRRDNDAVISKAKLKEADQKTLDRIDKKRKVYYPVSLEDDEFADSTPSFFEVHEIVLMHLPSGLHTSYWAMVHDGQNAVSRQHFTKIKKAVLELRTNGVI